MSRRNSAKKGMRKWIKFPFLNYIKFGVAFIVACVFIIFIGKPLLSFTIQKMSPWADQKAAISKQNNVRDAYSAIIGSRVGVIPKNGITQWFSSKEASEIDIAIPKIINYSPLFDDTSHTDILKLGFLNSINEDVSKKSTDVVMITYNGATIGEIIDGKLEKDFTDMNNIDAQKIDQAITKVLINEKNIKFKEWQKIGTKNNVEYKIDDTKNKIKITGRFESDGTLFLTPAYKISIELKLVDNNWEFIPDTLEVEKL